MAIFFLLLSLLSYNVDAAHVTLRFSDAIPIEIQKNAQRQVDQTINFPSTTPSEYRIEQLRRRIASLTQEAAQPFGYFSATCDTTVDRPGAQLVFSTTCQLNQPVRITNFRLEVSGPGKAVLDPIIFMSYYSLEGEVFNVERYGQQKNLLLDISRQHGFLDATTKQSTVSINPENHSAEIVLHLETGKRFQFGPIDIKGQTYDKDYLRSLALYKPGMMYDEALIAEYRNNLESTNLFTYVTVLPFNGRRSDQIVPTEVFYEPTPRLQYGLGAGVNSSHDFFYSAIARRNRLNSKGMLATSELLSSNHYGYFVTTLSIPSSHPTKDFYTLRLGYRFDDIDYVGEDRNLTLSTSHVLVTKPKQHLSLRRELSLNYSLDRSKYDGRTTHETQFLYPGLDFARRYDYPDRLMTILLSQEIIGNVRQLASPTDFIKLVMHERLHKNFSDLFAISTRLTQGVVRASSSDDQLPISWYFYTGGAYSVRGFEYLSIGADPNDPLRQNNYLYTGSVELQRAIVQDTFGILFVDAGEAMPSLRNRKTSYAFGVGVMWQSFVGNLEVSIAKPIRNYSSNPSMSPRFNFRIYQPLSKDRAW